MSNDQQNKKCRYCRESIHIDSKVCHYCSRHQNRFWQHFGDVGTWVSIPGIVISILMLCISLSQLREAREERIAAQEASAIAVEARNTALSAQEKTEAAYQNIKQAVKAFAGITYFQGVTRNDMGTERAQEAWLQINDELNKLLQRILPDPNERSRFIQELNGRLPNKTN